MTGDAFSSPSSRGAGDACGHLIVVAGLPCSGKSYLMRALQAGHVHEVPEALHPSPEGSAFLAVRDADPGRLHGPQVYLHYDLHSNQVGLGNRLLPPLLSRADRVSWTTLVTPVDVLRKRHDSRLGSLMAEISDPRNWKGSRTLRRLRRAWKLRRLYRQEAAVHRIYRDWFRFGAENHGDHFRVEGTDGAFTFHAIDPLEEANAHEGSDPGSHGVSAINASLRSAP